MKEIPLTQGKVALVDDADFEAVSKFKWCASKSRDGWYAVRNVQKPNGTWTMQALHQFLMPGVPMVDHEDGDKLNDQRYNLRACTHSQNMRNARKRPGTSRFKGVNWYTPLGKWLARIQFEKKQYYIGYYIEEEDAARAYDTAAKQYHGEFARLNFP